MSPILVRPVREQLEHDRIIRLLQAKYKRKFEVAINPGTEQAAPVGGPPPWFPDLVLFDGRGKKVLGVVEVETIESVNHLEAMSQWVAFSRLHVLFHLYVPVTMIDVARRLCQDMQAAVGEIWTYAPGGDQLRFNLAHRSPQAVEVRPRVMPAPAPSRGAAPSARGKRLGAAPVRRKMASKTAPKKPAASRSKPIARSAKAGSRRPAGVPGGQKRR